MTDNVDLIVVEEDENRNSLNGITVGGEHLVSWLRHKSTDERTKEIHETRNDQINIHHGKHKAYLKKEENIGPRVSKRVRRLTDKEIRRQYGIMAKQYDSLSDNIIWCIVEKGPITNAEMMELLLFQKGSSSFAAIMTGIWHRLGDEAAQLIDRKKKPGNTFYEYQKKPGIELSVDAIIEQYHLWGKKDYRENQLAERRLKFLNSLDEQTRIEEIEKEKQLQESNLTETQKEEATETKNNNKQKMLQSPVENIAQNIAQTLGINISLSGSIKILFGFTIDPKND